MAKKIINIGKSQNKGDGDPLRTAFSKVNDNFDELYSGTFTDTTDFTTSIIPRTDNEISLGSSTKRWSELYVKDFIFINGVRLSGSASGDLVVGGNIVQAKDIVGSIFADDSTLMMDGLTGKHYGPLIGDVTGSVFADNSTMLVDGVNGRIVGPVFANVTGDTNGTHTGAVVGNVTGNLTGNISGNVTGNVVGDVTGSVFADDSSMLVDGVAGKLVLNNNTTAELPEQGNLYFTNARADARVNSIVTQAFVNTLNITAASTVGTVTGTVTGTLDGDVTGSVFGDDSTLLVDAVNNIIPSSVVSGTEATNWNTAYSWGDHSVAGYLTSVPAQTFASLTGKPTTVAGYGITDAHTGAFDGEVTGSVFGDDSTLLVDGNNNKIVGPVLSSDLRSTSPNVRIGLDAGLTNQGTYSIAIGERAGNLNQSADGIAIGYAAGRDDQQTDGIAIGQNAGQVNQGASSVAIGTMVGKTNQHANTIMLSATGATFNSTQANALFVKPIRSAAGTTMLMYDATSGEVTHNNTLAALDGSALTNVVAATIAVNDESSDATCFPFFGTGAISLSSGLSVKTDSSAYTYNASTGTLSATVFSGGIVATTATPPTGNADAGATGEIRYDDNYLYIKTASGWKRTALSGIV